MTVLTRDQLLHLVDRAARHVISPAEVELLRRSVLELVAVGASVDAVAVQLRYVRLERNAALMEATVTGVLSVGCRYCGAGPGQRCRVVRGALPPRGPHACRVRAAGLAAVAA
ncbi:MAG: hypothetical protein HOZ81_50360 [Streptomyces sp.]|nr:hypothetical protein [Streptomyces sp.]NUS24378.1 hypothetical protein [Streptomyces sp.]